MSLNSRGIKEEVNSSAHKKLYRQVICHATGKCTYCPLHGGIDNRSRDIDRKRQKACKYRRKSH